MTTNVLSKTKTSLPSVFEDFFKPWNEWIQPNEWMTRFPTLPAVNILENKEEFDVTLAAPGLKKDDFKVNLDGNQLTISCENESATEVKEEKYSRKEFSYSSFRRSFMLPDTVVQDKISAHYEDGILRLRIPKKEEVKRSSISKLIEVN